MDGEELRVQVRVSEGHVARLLHLSCRRGGLRGVRLLRLNFLLGRFLFSRLSSIRCIMLTIDIMIASSSL